MLRYLLDTSVYSQPLRNRAVEPALQHWQKVGDASCAISIISVAELEFGLEWEGVEARRKKYEALLRGRLLILSTTEEVWLLFGHMKARQRRLGETIADLDLLIAAVAKLNGLTVATLNSNDFKRIEGISWEDWTL